MNHPQEPFGVYIHVPFCAARCGYCDFNTYVPDGRGQQHEFVDAALLELRQAHAEIGDRPASTVFVGGGTPTLLGAGELLRLLTGVGDTFGLTPDAEITTEANPESVDAGTFRILRRGGFTRVSLGMQSAVPHVLRTLDRVHTPGRAVTAALEAREAGFEHVSLDLIYGTPGESEEDWERSLEAALSAEPDHVSAYALTVEPGTGLAAAIRRRELPAPDDDEQARRFVRADEHLYSAGFDWYELASWAQDDESRCHHNIGYWRSFDWWGVGPGAHSHLDGVRWWNVRRPTEYAQRLRRRESPIAGREVLTPEQRALEEVMLGLRLREGLELSSLNGARASALEDEIARDRVQVVDGRVQLTLRGRLFADAVARELSV
jgi:putative oxygen-independent coproporphyrinogen III oxidase